MCCSFVSWSNGLKVKTHAKSEADPEQALLDNMPDYRAACKKVRDPCCNLPNELSLYFSTQHMLPNLTEFTDLDSEVYAYQEAVVKSNPLVEMGGFYSPSE